MKPLIIDYLVPPQVSLAYPSHVNPEIRYLYQDFFRACAVHTRMLFSYTTPQLPEPVTSNTWLQLRSIKRSLHLGIQLTGWNSLCCRLFNLINDKISHL